MKRLISILLIFIITSSLTNISAQAKTKKIKLSVSKVSLSVGSSKTITLKNVKKKVKWKVSGKDKISILKKSGKYKNKIKIKAKKSGSVTLMAVYKNKKYKCKIVIKNNSKKSNTPSSLLDSAFQYAKVDEYSLPLGYYGNNYLSTKTKNGELFIPISSEAQNLTIKKDSFSYKIKNKVFDLDVEYKIINDISSVADCERRINSIVSKIPNTLNPNYIKHDEKYSEDVRDVLNSVDRYIYDKTKADLDNVDLSSVWYTTLNKNGCSYFLEESSRDEKNVFRYKKMIAESYNYIDGVCLYLKEELNYYNYMDVYNSFDTVTEKNDFVSEYEHYFLDYFVEAISGDLFTINKDGGNDGKYVYLCFPDPIGYINKETLLIKE